MKPLRPVPHAGRLSAPLLQALLAASGELAVLALDVRRDVVFASGRGLLDRHGREPQEMVGLRIDDVLAPEELRQLEPIYERALAGRHVEGEVWTTGGAACAVQAAPLLRDGRVTGAVTLWRDVTSPEAPPPARERFVHVFEDAPIGMAITRLDGRFLEVNRGLCEIVGRSEQELLATDVRTVTHPDDVRADEDLAAALIAGQGQSYRIDKRYVRPDGTQVPVALRVSIVRHTDGSPAYLIGLVVDISHRRKVEQTLSDERDFLAALLDSLDAGVAACDADGRLTLFNAYAARMHVPDAEAATAEEWPGRYRLCHPDGRRMGREEVPLVRALGGEHVRDAEMLIGLGGPDPRVLSVNAQTITSADGRRLGAVAVQHDVTEHRRLEEALRAAEARWRDAFEHAPVGMAIVALDGAGHGVIRSANRALGELVGLPPQALERREFAGLACEGEDAERAVALLAQVLADPVVRHDDELRLAHATNGTVWAHVSAKVTPHASGGTAAVVHLTDVSERKGYEERLEHLADHDALTGFFNRRRFDEELARAVAVARRQGRPGALLLIDLDQFKYVNDTYGHPVGDEVIQHAGTVLRTRLRDTDVLARIGGDEFAALLPDTGLDRAAEVAGQLLEELRENAPEMSTGQRLALTASIGVTPITADGRLAPGELLMEADISMYDAKGAGRNRVAVASPGRHEHARMKARLTWAERIRHALAEERFELHGQPIVRTCDGAVDRHEVLIRLRDEQGALVAPEHFLDIAERFGQIQEIDRWVIGEAVAALRRAPDLRLAINLSGASIGDARTIGLLSELLAGSSADAQRLTVEITETAAIGSIDVARGFAQHVAELGCRLALDDFGSGFGSFFYLKHLPFTCLKIDGEFIRGVATSRSDRLTVEAIVQIAKALGKETTAEYVADERTLELVRELGVDYVQGHLVGRPGPVPGLPCGTSAGPLRRNHH